MDESEFRKTTQEEAKIPLIASFNAISDSLYPYLTSIQVPGRNSYPALDELSSLENVLQYAVNPKVPDAKLHIMELEDVNYAFYTLCAAAAVENVKTASESDKSKFKAWLKEEDWLEKPVLLTQAQALKNLNETLKKQGVGKAQLHQIVTRVTALIHKEGKGTQRNAL